MKNLQNLKIYQPQISIGIWEVWGIHQILFLKSIITVVSWHLGIWEISCIWKKNCPQILKSSGNSPDSQVFGKFLWFPGIWGISLIPMGISVYFWDFRNFTGRQKFPIIEKLNHIHILYGIWETSLILRHFGNFPDYQVFWEFPIFTILMIAVTPYAKVIRSDVGKENINRFEN